MNRSLRMGLLFESVLGVVGWVLIVLFGKRDWLRGHLDLSSGVVILGWTLFFVSAYVWSSRWEWEALRKIDEKLTSQLGPLIQQASIPALGLLALSAGWGEELLFRACIQKFLSEAGGVYFGLGVGSLLFGLVHFLDKTYFILATLMGLFLGAIFEHTSNLAIVVGIHFLYDWALLILLRRKIVGGSSKV